MVDTKENKPLNDSVPFERPGIPRPTWVWLNVLGVLWSPSPEPATEPDPVPFGWRLAVACLACVAFIAAALVFQVGPGRQVVFLAVTLPVLAGLVTWAMLQFLPRSHAAGWSLVNRVLTVAMVTGLGAVYSEIIHEAFNVRFDDDLVPCLVFLGLCIDWRCFISADRYPRVGVVRTAVAMAAFLLFPVIDDGSVDTNSGMVLASLMVAAVVISIQLLAPHHRIVQNKVAASKPVSTGDRIPVVKVTEPPREAVKVKVIQEKV